MPEWQLWSAFILAVGLALWRLAFSATKRIYVRKHEADNSESVAGRPVAGDESLNMEEQ